MIVKRDELFKVVCCVRTGDAVGTGTFVCKDNIVYLVTATHVAVGTNPSSDVILSDINSKPFSVNLFSLMNGNVWQNHSIADISIVQIDTSINQQLFTGRCFPYDHINLVNTCASRDDQLTVVGFPNGLGIQGFFSPLTFRSHPSSSLLTLSRADTRTLSDFFCLENPSVGGYSGGPVFDMGYEIVGCAEITKEKTVLHGFVHGTMSDNTGGKIALISPSYFLKDLFKKP